MQTSVKQIIEGIETIVNTYFSDEIKYVGFQKYLTDDIQKDCIALIYYVDSYPTSNNVSKVSIRFEFLDVIAKADNRNTSRKEVLSDTAGVASSVIDFLKTNGFYIDEGVATSVIEAKGLDGVAGTEVLATFNYQQGCNITGDGYRFKALTIGKLIDTTDNFTVPITDVTENDSGLDGTFKSISTEDAELNISLNEGKTELTIQTDVIDSRFSNIYFTATNGVVNSIAEIVNYISSDVPPPVEDLLLDLFPNANGAYSLRKLRTDYNGFAIRVRRSIDNAELDIGFVDNELDTASLLSFVGSGDGYVTIWYDQSGLFNNLVQVLAAKQAEIVSSGVVNLKNGKPCLVFNGSSNEYPTTEFDIDSGAYMFSVGSINKMDSTLYNLDGAAVGTSHTTANKLGYRYFNIKVKDYSYGSQFSFTFFTTNPEFGYVNSIELTEAGILRAGSSYAIGSRVGSFYLDGTFQEMVLYNSNQSANRIAIETNINNYYSIY